MSEELKPCPWCGNNEDNFCFEGEDSVMVYCGACARGVEGMSGDKKDAITAWNTVHARAEKAEAERDALAEWRERVAIQRLAMQGLQIFLREIERDGWADEVVRLFNAIDAPLTSHPQATTPVADQGGEEARHNGHPGGEE